MASEGLHESADLLSAETIDIHRGFQSLIEELEAADWYNQRVDAAGDAELVRVLGHARDEEKEHASMMLEWLRRHDSALDAQLRRYLFTDRPLPLPEGEGGSVSGDDAAPTGQPDVPTISNGSGSPGDSGSAGTAGTLGIGSLRGAEMLGGI